MNTTDNNIQERFQRGGDSPDAVLASTVIPERFLQEVQASEFLADNALAYMQRAVAAMGNASLGGVDHAMFQPNVGQVPVAKPVENVASSKDYENVTQTGAYEPLRSEPPVNQDAYSAAVLAINDPTKPETPATNESEARNVVGAIFAEAEAKVEAEATYIADGLKQLEEFANKSLENA